MFKNQLSSLSNFEGIQLETDICIITLDDNISHTYCSKIKWEKDNYNPLGVAQLIMPYDKQIESYWVKYSGTVVIHANLNSKPQSMTQALMYNLPATQSLNMKNFETKQTEDEKEVIKKKDKKNKIHLQNDEYNYSFIGKVSRFKQVGQTFIVYLEDLGWKFLQKVPKEFRDTYISGQSLDNAFQAICEFMGVDFAYSIEDLNQYQFSADGYSIEKNGEVIEDVTTILSEWKAEKEEDEENKTEDEAMADAIKDGNAFESEGLDQYRKQKTEMENKIKNNNNDTSALNSQVTNADSSGTDTQTENENTNDPSEKISEYQEEFDDKIKDLFIGNTLYDSNISDPILNYNWITITPTAPVSETTSNTSTNTQNNENGSNNQNNQDNQNNNENNNQEATQ